MAKMIALDSRGLLKLLDNNTENSITISGFEIHIEESIDINLCIDTINFKNCSFSGERIDFYDFLRDESKDEYASLSFVNCQISNNLFIKDCWLYNITLHNVQITSKLFFIASCDIRNIVITGNSKNHNIIKSLTLNNLQEQTSLDIRLNDFEESLLINNSNFSSVTINGNNINRIDFAGSIFSNDISFWKNHLISYSKVFDCTFNDFNSNDSDFGTEFHFEKVKFLGVSHFENLKNTKSKLKFTRCNFEKHIYFDKSNLYTIELDTAFFKEIVSFQNITCHALKFNRTHFDKVAFFDSINITNPGNCDLKTIRLIKNQLLKIDNKVDYFRYLGIEHNNLLHTKNLSFNDRLLLKLNRNSNNFGNEWLKGVGFTLSRAIILFVILLIANNFVCSKYPLIINYQKDLAPLSQTLSEFLKFVFSLGFNNEDIQSSGVLYLIFIIAKIYIGYGIFQTVSAFRKYGKN